MDHSAQTVLVTGASSGIGAAFAREVARRGSDLVLVARRAERLEALAAELTAAHGTTVEVVPADLALPGAAEEVTGEIERRGVRVTSLVNNAGFGDHGRVHDQDPARLQEIVAVNVGALVGLSRGLLPALREGDGYLLNVASLAAYQPIPDLAVYAATKAFVLSFTEALWYESKGTRLRVLCLSPGMTGTEFFDVAGAGAGTSGRKQTVEQVVATALKALDRRDGPPSVVSGGMNRLTSGLNRLLPRRTTVELTARATSSR
ncbi:SDR family oxidoreductase [Pseudonocardia ailaonensis]|uniref:SDR family oxidoreductase n=1 Tax=Pseudonocardia ailaonensis TaxID=367279 RepID=A0ABN2NKA6_9PSEU